MSPDPTADRFFENTMEMACIAADGRLTRVNHRWVETLGWSEDQLLARPFMEFVHPDDRASTVEAVQRLMRGEPVVHFRNRYQRADGTWAVLEWSSSADVESGVMYGSAHDVTAEVRALAERDRMHKVLAAQAELQDLFMRHGVDRGWWDIALGHAVAATDSAFGFVGRIEHDDEGPLLRSLAVTDVAWNDWSRRAFAEFAGAGLEFRNLDSLYGATITTSGVVISDDPTRDPRSCGLPEGHPPMDAYLGVPLVDGGTLVGMVGLANRPGGYDQDVVAEVSPILAVMTHIIVRADTDRRIAEAASQIADLARGEGDQAALATGVGSVLAAPSFRRAAAVAHSVLARVVPGARVATYAVTATDADMMALAEGDPDVGPLVARSACRAFVAGRAHLSRPGGGESGCAHVAPTSDLALCVPIHTTDASYGLLTLDIPTGGISEADDAGRVAAAADAAERLAAALAQVALRDDLASRALADGLTELPNRTAFVQALERRLRLLHVSARPFAVLLVDVDDFKGVNDRLGHLAGDTALQGLADALRACIRGADVAARLGGDEFAVMIGADDEASARGVAERVIQHAQAVADAGGTALSVSVGGVLVGWGDLGWLDIYDAADQALYRAKRAGRHRVELAAMLGRPTPGGAD